ncbi:MAG: non-heme iron oxygenase ferredoxin subunit [Verrucomicrobiales bacterium]
MTERSGRVASTRHVVCKTEVIAEGRGESFTVAGVKVAVFNIDGEFFVLEDRCSHADAPLAGGYVHRREKCVACPWHGAEFDLRTGKTMAPPACEDIKAYPALVEDGQLSINLPD